MKQIPHPNVVIKSAIHILLISTLSFSCILAQDAATKDAPKQATKETAKPEQTTKPAEAKEEEEPDLITKGLRALLGKHGGDKLFYMPNRHFPYTPKKYGYKYEDITFKSKDGTELNGWFLPSKKGPLKAHGTIVFSHGTSFCMPYHFGFIDWLVDSGYNVWMFDYRGYGKSKGRTNKRGIIEDTIAAFKYIKTRKDIAQDKIISFGHSLGAAKSVAALAEYAPKGLKGVVIMGSFASYPDIAKTMGGKIGKNMVSNTFNPEQLVSKLPKVPVLVMHGKEDEIIPFSHGQRIFNKANQPKTLISPEKGGHNDLLFFNKGKYSKRLNAWLKDALK